MKTKRIYRMAELIQSVIARLIIKEVSDPRLNAATITGVDLAPDKASAKVFFSILDVQPESIKLTEKAFAKANGFFRFHLSRLTELRYTPKLTFHYDMSLVTGERVSELLKTCE